MRPHLMHCGRGAASYPSFTASQQQPTLSPKIDLHHQRKPNCHLQPFPNRRSRVLYQTTASLTILNLLHPALNTQRPLIPKNPIPTNDRPLNTLRQWRRIPVHCCRRYVGPWAQQIERCVPC